MSYAGLTGKQVLDKAAKSSILRLMREVSMFGRDDFSECFGHITAGGRDIVEGVCWAWSGIWRLAYMLALYAVYPISKPIMCAVYRKKFRSMIKKEDTNGQSKT